VALAKNAVADMAADAAAFPAVASALPTAAVMGETGKIPAVASTVSSAEDPLADAMAIPTVALAIPIPLVAVGGDVGNISVMALAMTSAVEGGAILAVASAIPTMAVGGDVGKIPAMASTIATAVS